jgi:hypothetical protein
MNPASARTAAGGSQGQRRTALALLLPLLGMIALGLMTRHGIGTSPDSVQYIRTARDLIAADGGQAGPRAGAQFAPLYSLLLAGAGAVGVDPMDGARWLNVIVFGLNIAIVGLIVQRTTRNTGWLWALGSVFVLGSMPVLSVHVAALSEPVFLLFGLVGLYWLGRYLENRRRGVLVAAAIAVSLAFLARYAGAAWVLAGGLAILAWGPRPLLRRAGDAALFGVLSSMPMLVWLVQNAAAGGSATGRELLFHPIGKAHLWQALYTTSGWILIPASAPNSVRLAVWLAAAVALIAVVVSRSTARPPMPRPVAVLAVFIGCYLAFVVASISLFDANTPLDDRILLPVFAASVVVALYLVDAAWPRLEGRPVLRYGAAGAIAIFTAAHVANGVAVAAATYESGWGLSSRQWQASPTVARARALPIGVPVFSNAPEILYLHTGRLAQPIPKKVLLMTQQPNAAFAAQLAEMRHVLSRSCGVVVYFRNLAGQKAAPSERELAQRLSLRITAEARDGAVLGTSECPAP